MKTKLAFLFLICMSLSKINVAGQETSVLPEKKNEAFKPGEVLEYRVHYGIFEAGVARLEVMKDLMTIGGRPCYRMVGTGTSSGACDLVFKVRDHYETIMDQSALLPWLFIRRVDEGGYKVIQNVRFMRNTKVVVSDKSTLNMPDNLHDIISAFYYMRNIDFSDKKKGDVIEISAWLDDEIIPLNSKVIGREKLKTKLGTFNCIMLRPQLQEGRVFKDNEDLTIWVSDDKNHIPIRAEAKILVGSIKMDLMSYENLANPINFAK